MLVRLRIPVILAVLVTSAQGQEPAAGRRPARQGLIDSFIPAPSGQRRPEPALPGVLQSLPARFAGQEPTGKAPDDLPEITGPAERVVVFTHNAPVMQLAPLINAHFQGDGQGRVRAIAEPVSNCLMITASPELLPEVTSLVRELDRAPEVISLEVLVVERSKREPAAVTGAPSRASPSDTAAQELPAGVAGPSEEVVARILRWEAEGKLSVLHRIRLTTLENQSGMIQVGQRRPVVQGVTMSTRGTMRNVIDKNVGMIVAATPRAASDGAVTVNLEFEKSDIVTHPSDPPLAVTTDGDKVESTRVNTSTAKTTLQIPAGQAMVITDVRTSGGGEQSRMLLVVSATVISSGAKGKSGK